MGGERLDAEPPHAGRLNRVLPEVAGEVVGRTRAAAVASDEHLPVVPVGLGQDVDRLLEFHGVQPGDRLGDHIGISL